MLVKFEREIFVDLSKSTYLQRSRKISSVVSTEGCLVFIIPIHI